MKTDFEEKIQKPTHLQISYHQQQQYGSSGGINHHSSMTDLFGDQSNDEDDGGQDDASNWLNNQNSMKHQNQQFQYQKNW